MTCETPEGSSKSYSLGKLFPYAQNHFCTPKLVVGKSPRFFPPPLPRNLEIFGDFPPKNPQYLGVPRPRSIPKFFKGFVPVINPEKRGNSGINPKNPQNFRWSHPQTIPKPFNSSIPVPKRRVSGTGKDEVFRG